MDISKVKVILIHGNETIRWSYKWMPWVKKEIEKLGVEVIAETFPDSILARERFWIPFLKEELHADENTILIGHSSGAIAAMRFVEKNKILGSILIIAYYTHHGEEMEKQAGYFNRDWDWEKIKNNQQWIVQFSSKDEPWIPVEEFSHVHEMLNTEHCEFEDKGHFLNQNTFPEIIEVIKNKLNQ